MEEVSCSDNDRDEDALHACDVCILNSDLHFQPVDEERREPFVKWWPSAARALVNGMFAPSAEERDRAATQLMPVLEKFRCTQDDPSSAIKIAVFNPALRRFSDLLATRLIFEQQNVRRIGAHWIQKVQEFYERCTIANSRHKNLLDDLTNSAFALAKLYSDREGSYEIIQKQAVLFSQRARHEHDMDVRAIRMEILGGCDVSVSDVRQLDEKIAAAKRALSASHASEVQALEMVNAARVEAAEHEAAKEVQDMCRKYWIHALVQEKE